MLVAQAANMVIGFGSVAVLGRLLTPDHFGLVAIATSLMVPVSALCDHGMPLALIQRKSPTLSETNAMFWLQCSLGLLAAAVGAALAYPLGAWLDRPELFWILMAFSGNLALAGLGATHLALIRRDLRFRTHAGIGVLANLCAVLVGILAAWFGLGYWSLVLMGVANNAFTTGAAWICSGWLPNAPQRVEGIRDMVRMGLFLNGTALVSSMTRVVDRVLIGLTLSDAAAGYYANAHRLILQPSMQVNKPLTTVAVPVLSRLQHDECAFRKYYRRGAEVIVLALFPCFIVAFFGAEYIVPLVLGSQWDEAIPIFQALCPGALMTCTRVLTGWIYVPLGRTDRQFRWRIFASIVAVGSFVVGIQWGVYGLAVAYSIQSLAIRIPAVMYCISGTFVRGSDVLSATARPVAATVGGVVAGFLILPHITMPDSSILALIIVASTLGLVYLGTFAATPGGITRLKSLRHTVGLLRRQPDETPSTA